MQSPGALPTQPSQPRPDQAACGARILKAASGLLPYPGAVLGTGTTRLFPPSTLPSCQKPARPGPPAILLSFAARPITSAHRFQTEMPHAATPRAQATRPQDPRVPRPRVSLPPPQKPILPAGWVFQDLGIQGVPLRVPAPSPLAPTTSARRGGHHQRGVWVPQRGQSQARVKLRSTQRLQSYARHPEDQAIRATPCP
jgi:hypothetical protein